LEITGAFTTLDVPLYYPKTVTFMDEQSKAALDLLVQNDYLEIVKGKYRPTKKLNEIPVVEAILVGIDGETLQGSWTEIYTKFIMDCKIPRYGETGDGTLYDLNKYTEDGMKHFRDLIRSGIKYSLLVKVTIVYYQGSPRYKKKIGNYITEGHWRLDYDVMKNQSVEQQIETIKQQIDAAKPFTRDRIG
jgi:hypothetical protein